MSIARVDILTGHVLDRLAELPAKSIHCCLTSPPYWGLRDYKTEPVEWSDGPGKLGLEPTLEQFIGHMVEVFDAVKRVLRDDGTCWVNLGDSYSSGGAEKRDGGHGFVDGGKLKLNANKGALLAPKHESPVDAGNLCLQPARFALAMQQAGWVLRSRIIWAKSASLADDVTCPGCGCEFPAPPGATMPESVSGTRWERCRVKVGTSALSENGGYGIQSHRDAKRREVMSGNNPLPRAESIDCPGCPKCEQTGGYVLRRGSWRPTSAYEEVLLFAKAGQSYFCDKEAVREEHVAGPIGTPQRDTRETHGTGRGNSGLNAMKAAGVATGRNLRNVWRINTQAYPDAHFACVDDQTECLTDGGWKLHHELSRETRAAQYDLTTGLLSWALIDDVARYDVTDQEMVAVEQRDLSMWLTPNHRCIVRTDGLWQGTIKRADALHPEDTIPIAGLWQDNGDVRPFDTAWAELIGWYVAEGHERKQGRMVDIYQSQSANPEKCDRIRGLLSKIGADWGESTGKADCVCFTIRGPVAAILRDVVPGKEMLWSWVHWSVHLISALLDGLIGGDGHTRSDGRRCFIQKDKRTCDIVQVLALRCGWAATVTHRPDGQWTTYITGRHGRTMRGTAGCNKEISRSTYTGVVWCPKTPHGTWVARRNGRVFITGNTYPESLVEPIIKAATSDKGVCPTCGAPWARVVEDRTPRTWTDRREDVMNEGTRGLSWDTSSQNQTLGWRPTCGCKVSVSCPEASSCDNSDGWYDEQPYPIPATVLDPFAGSGTTGLVARKLGRNAILIELNEEYAEMARRRIGQYAPLFAGETNDD